MADMTAEGVAAYMGASTSEADWDRRVNIVRGMHGGRYPECWSEAVLESGLCAQTLKEVLPEEASTMTCGNVTYAKEQTALPSIDIRTETIADYLAQYKK